MADSGAPRALRHLWASPAVFVMAAFVAFNVVGRGDAGWVLMGAGLSGPVAALAWHAVRRERPETAFVVVPLGLLALMTVLFGINEGFPWG